MRSLQFCTPTYEVKVQTNGIQISLEFLQSIRSPNRQVQARKDINSGLCLLVKVGNGKRRLDEWTKGTLVE